MGINNIAPYGAPPAVKVLPFQQNAGQLFNVASGLGQNGGGVVRIALAPGEVSLIPAGNYVVEAGGYTDIQYFDGASQQWRNITAFDASPTVMISDGTNYRLANLSGCAVGAVITNAGTLISATYPVQMITAAGYWQGGTFIPIAQAALPFTTVISAGGSTWNTFVGGAINQTVTISNAGTNYTLPPLVVVVPAAAQGNQPFIPASVAVTISGGVINAVTVIDQGAGYVVPPTLLVMPAPGDLTGAGGVLTAALTGTGQITAILMATPGTALAAVPTFSFTNGSVTAPAGAAATALMNFSILPGGTPVAGAGYTVGYELVAQSGVSTATPTYKNPDTEKGIVSPVQPQIYAVSTTVIAITAAMIQFAGAGFQTVPSLVGLGAGMTTAGGIAAPVVGGVNDSCTLYPI